MLVLTVADIFGRLPYVGATPYVKPLKLDVYEVLQTIDPDTVSCTEYSSGNAWTNSYGRNVTDRAASPMSSVTIGTNVKPGDQISFDLTSLARKVAANKTGVMNFMIEAPEWYRLTTGTTVAQDAVEKVAMLVQFHSSGNNGPKIKMNLMSSKIGPQLAPGVARRRLIGA
jgi:hypothetical protein